MHLTFIIGLVAFISWGCQGARVAGGEGQILHGVARIAMSPAGGQLADDISAAVRTEKGGETVEVLSTAETAELLKKTGVMSIKATLPENLAKLRAENIDAWIRIEAIDHQIAQTPRKVNVQVTSTHDPTQMFKFTWHNAWGGAPGSPADASMRLSYEAAVGQIAGELAARLP